MITMEDLLALLVRKNGSDLHLSTNSPPRLRLDGILVPVETDVLTSEDVAGKRGRAHPYHSQLGVLLVA